jgi:hypothetical protein
MQDKDTNAATFLARLHLRCEAKPEGTIAPTSAHLFPARTDAAAERKRKLAPSSVGDGPDL